MKDKTFWLNADMYQDEQGYIRTAYLDCLIFNIINHTHGSKLRSRYDAIIEELRLFKYHIPFTDVIILAQTLCMMRHVEVTYDLRST